MKTKYLKSIRLLYTLYACILFACLGLFISNVISAEEKPQMAALTTPNIGIAFSITDLHADLPLYAVEQDIEGMPKGITAHAHINRFDVDVVSDPDNILHRSRLNWVLALQLFEICVFASIIILVVLTLVSFYKSAKQGHVFPNKKVTNILIIGVLLVVMSLCLDTSAYLERTLAYDLLSHTQWLPQVHFTIHFTRIFFGLTLIFLSQIFRIGRELQEEHELTI